MHLNANLSPGERERLAYMAGDTALASTLADYDETWHALDGITDHGIFGGDDAKALIEQRDQSDTLLTEAREFMEETAYELGRLGDDLSGLITAARGERRKELHRIVGALEALGHALTAKSEEQTP